MIMTTSSIVLSMTASMGIIHVPVLFMFAVHSEFIHWTRNE